MLRKAAQRVKVSINISLKELKNAKMNTAINPKMNTLIVVPSSGLRGKTMLPSTKSDMG